VWDGMLMVSNCMLCDGHVSRCLMVVWSTCGDGYR
jgi:prepilin-type processing-associated H-X9-DG protein